MSLFKKNNIRKKLIQCKLETGRNEADSKVDGDNVTISLKLGKVENIFTNGMWIPKTKNGGEVEDENLNMKRSVSELEEKNNLLRLKYEILMDMLIEHLTSTLSKQTLMDEH